MLITMLAACSECNYLPACSAMMPDVQLSKDTRLSNRPIIYLFTLQAFNMNQNGRCLLRMVDDLSEVSYSV
jgi:hypothetical protein